MSDKHRKKLVGSLILLLILLAAALTATLLHPPLTQDQRFEAFSKQMFQSELCGSTLNLHYTLANPSSYDIGDYPITLGTMDEQAHLASSAQVENYLNALNRFSRDELAAPNRLTYDILIDYLKTSQEGDAFYLYNEPLGSTLGIQAQLPVLLAEYTFRTRQDIEDYLALLTQIPDYFQSIIDFEKKKAAAGLFMSDVCVTNILEQCNSFARSGKDNYLKQIFDDQIDSFTNLSVDEKISYKKQNAEILDAYVVPAYEDLMNALANLLGKGQNSGGLYYLPQGVPYYEYLVHSTTGDASSVEEIEVRIKEEIVKLYGEIQQLLRADSGLTSASLEQYTPQEPTVILEQLQNVITDDFPAAPSVSCQVKYVHDSLKDYLSPAFYMIPPIDDTADNVIYINPTSSYNALELYTTLAHEGYPGHLYQTVSFENENNNPLRSILSFGGYVEGWATYVELYAYSTWKEDPLLASLYEKDRSLMLGIASLLDIGIHYHGYTRSDVAAFLSRFGITAENADTLYDTILEAPANYLKYYVGYLNFQDLQTYAKTILGDQFTLKEYHARVLKIGPCSFPVLKAYLTDTEYLLS